MGARLGQQADLFDTGPDPEYLDNVREHVAKMLAFVRAHETLPWRDPTVSLINELEFRRAAEKLPEPEGSRLLEEWECELDRFWGPRTG